MATAFNLASALQAAFGRTPAEPDDGDPPLSLDPLPPLDEFSPLSTPSSSPCSSRSCSPTRASIYSPPSRKRPQSPDHSLANGQPPTKRPRVGSDVTRHPSSSEAAASTTQPVLSNKAQRKKNRAKERWRKKRAEKKAIARAEGTQYRDAFTYKVPKTLSSRYQAAQVIRCDVDAFYLPKASTSYMGLRKGVGKVLVTLEDLLADGFRLIEWDGM